jgi:hypothetical protein
VLGHDAAEPGHERAGVAQIAQVQVGLEERLLHHVAGQLVVPEPAEGEAPCEALDLGDERVERDRLAALGRRDHAPEVIWLRLPAPNRHVPKTRDPGRRLPAGPPGPPRQPVLADRREGPVEPAVAPVDQAERVLLGVGPGRHHPALAAPPAAAPHAAQGGVQGHLHLVLQVEVGPRQEGQQLGQVVRQEVGQGSGPAGAAALRRP